MRLCTRLAYFMRSKTSFRSKHRNLKESNSSPSEKGVYPKRNEFASLGANSFRLE